MGSLSASQQIHRYIERASMEELLCLVAIVMAGQTDEPVGCKCPDMPATKGAYKRAIKRLREAQVSCPEDCIIIEGAIQFIRREWLRKGGDSTVPEGKASESRG